MPNRWSLVSNIIPSHFISHHPSKPHARKCLINVTLYLFRSNDNDGYTSNHVVSDPYEMDSVKSYDHMLHEKLSKIFGESCPTSGQIKSRRRSAPVDIDKDSIFELILEQEQEPALGKLFPRINKLSLLWSAVLCCYQNSTELLVRLGANVNKLYGSHDYNGLFDELDEKSSIIHALLHMYPSSWNERFIGLVVDSSRVRRPYGSTFGGIARQVISR